MLKKIRLALLSVFICLCLFPIQSYALENNEFNYIIYDNEVVIISYIGNKQDVIIPETIDGLKVTSISQEFMAENYAALHSLYIPKTIEKVHKGWYDAYFLDLNVEEFIVDMNNKIFDCYDGAIYTKNYQTLLKIPDKKSIQIHENVNKFQPGCFDYTKIESITIPKNVQSFRSNYESGLFEGCDYIKK